MGAQGAGAARPHHAAGGRADRAEGPAAALPARRVPVAGLPVAAGLGGILADDMGLGKTAADPRAGAARARGAAPAARSSSSRRPASVANWAHEAAALRPRPAGAHGHRDAGPARAPPRRAVAAAPTSSSPRTRCSASTLEDYARCAWARPGARRGAVRQEPPARKTYQARARLDAPFTARAHRHAAREPPDGPVVAARRSSRPGLLPAARSGSPSAYREPDRARAATPSCSPTLRRRIRPFMLRRTKEEVAAELPPKQEQVRRGRRSTPRAPQALRRRHLQRERQKVLGLRRRRRQATGSRSSGRSPGCASSASTPALVDPDVRRDRLGEGRRARRAPRARSSPRGTGRSCSASSRRS